MDAQQLKAELDQFSGTEQYHRLTRNILLTDGAKYLAAQANAYWLMDLIASHQSNRKVRDEYFQTWKLTVTGNAGPNRNAALAVCEDGNYHQITKQSIPYTDFPLPEITLWAIWDDALDARVILLPGEY